MTENKIIFKDGLTANISCVQQSHSDCVSVKGELYFNPTSLGSRSECKRGSKLLIFSA